MTKNEHIKQLELQLNTERKFRDDIEMVQRIIKVGLDALSVRMLTSFVLLADCALFAWAMAAGGWQSLVVAVLFAIAAWCVLYLKPPERKVEEP